MKDYNPMSMFDNKVPIFNSIAAKQADYVLNSINDNKHIDKTQSIVNREMR